MAIVALSTKHFGNFAAETAFLIINNNLNRISYTYINIPINVPHSPTIRRANSATSIMGAYLISFADFWMMWNCEWLFHNSNVVCLRPIFYVTIFWVEKRLLHQNRLNAYAFKIEKEDSRPRPFQKSNARKGNRHAVGWNEKWTFPFSFTIRRISIWWRHTLCMALKMPKWSWLNGLNGSDLNALSW